MTPGRKSPTSRKLSKSAGSQPASRPSPALALAGVRPAKSRGQNFLTTPGVAERIVAAAEISSDDQVVEIGPGLGILSDQIVARSPRRLTLVELDSRLATRLDERFGSSRTARVINQDFLTVDFDALAGDAPLIVIGNLPFNVAAAILHRLCGVARRVSRMVLMFQREVAERIRARPGDTAYGALSVFTALYWEIDLHFTVSAGSFHPRPKVDAEVLRFRRRSPAGFEQAEEQTILAVVRASFSAPRKTIRNALGHALKLDSATVIAALGRASIDSGVRAETLAFPDFVRLAHALTGDLNAEVSARDA
ncbi:MAG: dimethyladenosine transferase [Candidatus Binatus sp.]|nr:dimethyladenosine transferase [Candidatus Binatus sp.]